jgi:hypothetical protein
MTTQKWLGGILALGLLPGCATEIKINQAVNRFDSPEVEGRRAKLDIGAGIAGTNQFVVSPDIAAQPLVTDPVRYQREEGLRADGTIGISDRLDFSLKLSTNTPNTIQFKYQLLGDPQNVAKKGNFAFAVSAAGGYEHDSHDGDNQPVFDSSPTITAHFDQDVYVLDTAAIFGYRLVDELLLYTGAFYTKTMYSGTVDQTMNGGTSHFHYEGDAWQPGMNLGLEIDPGSWIIRIEAAWAHARAGRQQTSEPQFGVFAAYRISAGSNPDQNK